MKRKLFTILLLCTLSISFTACGTNNSKNGEKISTSKNINENDSESKEKPGKAKTDSEQTDQESDSTPADDNEKVSEDLDALEDIDVDKGVFDVVLTIPAEFVGETTREELDENAAEYGYKVTLNDDGSATYAMTKSQHKEILKNIEESFNQELNKMIGSEDYPNFTKIEVNDNFTEFTVTTKNVELDINESFSKLVFYMYGGMYSVFSGEDINNVSVTFINADSGEVIETANSSDMGK